MKRVITFALALVLLLTMASCGKKEAEPTVAPTEAPVKETEAPVAEAPAGEPQWEPATSRAAYGEAVHAYLDAGTEVNVIGKVGDYYVIEGDEVDLLVFNAYVRLDSEEAFESWNGYAKSGTEVFDNVHMNGEAIETLKKNTKVTVLEGKGNWLLIEWEGGKGYVAASKISKWYIQAKTSSDGAVYAGGGSSGSVSQDGTNVGIGSLSAEYGAELMLLGAYYGPEQEPEFKGEKGIIILDSTEAYITLLLRGDEVKVTEYDEEFAIIWLEGELTAKVPRWLLHLEGDEEYEPWTAYSKWNGVIYEEYQIRNELKKLYTNKEVTVLDELPTCFVVEYEGEVGYVPKDADGNMLGFSKTKIRISSGGSSDGAVGSGTTGGGAGAGATWTPPAM